MENIMENNIWKAALKETKLLEVETKLPSDYTLLFAGHAHSGKSTLLLKVCNLRDNLESTSGLSYFYTSRDKDLDAEHDVCHIWELGGGIFNTALVEIPISLKTIKDIAICLVVDLTQLDTLIITVDYILKSICDHIQNLRESEEGIEHGLKEYLDKKTWDLLGSDPKENVSPFPLPLIIFGTKYDIFQDYDSEKKKVACRFLRLISYINGAHLQFVHQHSESLLVKAKVTLNHLVYKEEINKIPVLDYNKALYIPFGCDSLSLIGSSKGYIASEIYELIKNSFLNHFPQYPPLDILTDDLSHNPKYKETDIDVILAEKEKQFNELLKNRKHGISISDNDEVKVIPDKTGDLNIKNVDEMSHKSNTVSIEINGLIEKEKKVIENASLEKADYINLLKVDTLKKKEIELSYINEYASYIGNKSEGKIDKKPSYLTIEPVEGLSDIETDSEENISIFGFEEMWHFPCKDIDWFPSMKNTNSDKTLTDCSRSNSPHSSKSRKSEEFYEKLKTPTSLTNMLRPRKTGYTQKIPTEGFLVENSSSVSMNTLYQSDRQRSSIKEGSSSSSAEENPKTRVGKSKKAHKSKTYEILNDTSTKHSRNGKLNELQSHEISSSSVNDNNDNNINIKEHKRMMTKKTKKSRKPKIDGMLNDCCTKASSDIEKLDYLVSTEMSSSQVKNNVNITDFEDHKKMKTKETKINSKSTTERILCDYSTKVLRNIGKLDNLQLTEMPSFPGKGSNDGTDIQKYKERKIKKTTETSKSTIDGKLDDCSNEVSSDIKKLDNTQSPERTSSQVKERNADNDF